MNLPDCREGIPADSFYEIILRDFFMWCMIAKNYFNGRFV